MGHNLTWNVLKINGIDKDQEIQAVNHSAQSRESLRRKKEKEVAGKGKVLFFFFFFSFFGSDCRPAVIRSDSLEWNSYLIPKWSEAQPAELDQTDWRSAGQLRGQLSRVSPLPTGLWLFNMSNSPAYSLLLLLLLLPCSDLTSTGAQITSTFSFLVKMHLVSVWLDWTDHCCKLRRHEGAE